MIALLFLLSLAVSYADEPSQTNIFLAALPGAPYEPAVTGELRDYVFSPVLGQLLFLTEHFELEPSLLESWRWDGELRGYRLRLRKDLFFHNGRRVNIKDLEFSLLRGFYSKEKNYWGVYLGSIDGSEEVKPGSQYKSGQVRGVEIIGDHEVVVRLRRPNPAFLYSLVHPLFSLVPQEALQDDYMTWRTHPVGVGLFKVKKSFDGEKMILERLKPEAKRLNEVVLWSKFVPKVRFDIVVRPSAEIDTRSFEQYVSQRAIRTRGVYFSFLNPLGADPAFRRFIQSVIDRSSMKGGDPVLTPAHELLPTYTWGRNNPPELFKPDVAQSEFRKIKTPVKGKKLVAYVFGQESISDLNKRLIAIIDKAIAPFGIVVDWRPSMQKFLDPELAKDSPFQLSGMLSEHVDPLLMYGAFRSNTPNKHRIPVGGDPAFDALYEKAGQATDKPDRIKTMQALSQYVQDQTYFVPLAEEKNMVLHRKGLVKSFGRQTQSLILFLDQIELN